jgi:hypothetical protein
VSQNGWPKRGQHADARFKADKNTTTSWSKLGREKKFMIVWSLQKHRQALLKLDSMQREQIFGYFALFAQ